MRWACLSLLLCACQQILGIEEGEPRASEGGAAAQGGSSSSMGGSSGGGEAGSGNVGGGSGGTGAAQPVDWTPAFTALYRFEFSGNLGHDSTGLMNHIAATEAVAQGNTGVPEGIGYIDIPGTAVLQTSAAFASPPQSFTFGGWIRSTTGGDQPGIERISGNSGYRSERYMGGLRCSVGNSGALTFATTTGGWGPNDWVHTACRVHVNGGMVLLDAFVDGVAQGSGSIGSISHASSPFTLRESSWMDEVFFTPNPLADGSIRRIWACGVTGERCTCRDESPTDYDDCGQSDCDLLDACNAPEPVFLSP